MGDLSVALNNSGIGGYLGDAFLNHLCYADDICLILLVFNITIGSCNFMQLAIICKYICEHRFE